MKAVSYSKFRQNLRSFMRNVNEDAERLTVTTNDDSDIVVMSRSDYDSWMETIYLMRSPKNRIRIKQAIFDIGKGLTQERPLFEVD
ncbi:MAG: type II toxin-antitoxin system prevent-host-death family antitoxin [Lactobacillales bacterium]|jgi:antitoxin YefM|nr:type II toxin-antitoxin system prevent-host-death family antitoxin [Lactobacillales bacterium]